MLDSLTTKNSGQNDAPGTGTPAVVSMVDETRLLRVVKRLFTGSVKEVLGELLQNSQRAGAKNVIITTGENRLTMADDGTGLVGDGAAKFSSLMRIAESSYERAEVAMQDPMGVGLFSLFALEGVSEVVVSSNGFSLAIDTNRLWDEDGYWQAWENRVEHTDADAPTGLTLSITATAERIKKITENLTAKTYAYTTTHDLEYKSAVSGYTGVLDVFLNGEQLDTSCEFAKKMDEVFLETTYQGNTLIIGADSYPHRNIVNWYGQLITANSMHLRFYLEVREGRPVNPMSPSRRGIIDDTEFKNFLGFVRDRLRDYILTAAPENLSTLAVNTIYNVDKVWADQECPYFTANLWKHDAAAGNIENWAGASTESAVLSYADSPLLMDESVALGERVESGELSFIEGICYGAQTFVPVIEKVLGRSVYELRSGNQERLPVQQLWWNPGKDLDNFFVEAGEFTLCDKKLEIAPDAGWQPVGDDIVFAFECSENWDINSVDNLIVGVRDNLQSKIEFLDTDAWCIWSYENDDNDADTMETDYRRSLEAVKASLFKDCLPDDCLDLWRLMQHFTLESGERITKLEFIYPRGKNAQRQSATGIRLKTNLKRSLEKQFLSSAQAGVAA